MAVYIFCIHNITCFTTIFLVAGSDFRSIFVEQNLGLQDLSTNRTPEASIVVALLRDIVLFERIAPSTYCVRTQFRTDPDVAEEILNAAGEKIRLSRSGFLDGEEAYKEGDDVDREEYESEGQDVEDVEVSGD